MESNIKTIIRTSCDSCRTKKLRCELLQDRCAQCIKHDRTCTFTPVKPKMEPRRPPGYKHIEALEGRLKRMEQMMGRQASFPLSADDDDKDSAQNNTSAQPHPPNKRKRSRNSPAADSNRSQKRTQKQNHRVSFRSPSASPSRFRLSVTPVPIPEPPQHTTAYPTTNTQPSNPIPDWKLTAVPDILEASIQILYRVISHSQYTLPSQDLEDLEQVVRMVRRLRSLGLSTGGSIEVELKELVDEAKTASSMGGREGGSNGVEGDGGVGMDGGSGSGSGNGVNGINSVEDFVKRIVDSANCGDAGNWV